MRKSILDKQHYGFYKDRPAPDMLFLLTFGIFALVWISNYMENHSDYKIVLCSATLLFLILYRIFLHRRLFPLRPLVRIDKDGITIFTKEQSHLIPFENSVFVIFGTSISFRTPICEVKVAYFDGRVVDTSLPLDTIELPRLEGALKKFRPKRVEEITKAKEVSGQ